MQRLKLIIFSIVVHFVIAPVSFGSDCLALRGNLNFYTERALGAYKESCASDVQWPELLGRALKAKTQSDSKLKVEAAYRQDLVLLRALTVSAQKKYLRGDGEKEFLTQQGLMQILLLVNDYHLSLDDLFQINGKMTVDGLNELKNTYKFPADWLTQILFDSQNIEKLNKDFNKILTVAMQMREVEKTSSRKCFWVFGDDFDKTMVRINPDSVDSPDETKIINDLTNAGLDENFVIAQCSFINTAHKK